MNTTSKNLFFLLSLASMIIAGCDDGDEVGDGETSGGETETGETGDGDGDGTDVCSEFGALFAMCSDEDGEYAAYVCEQQIAYGMYYGMACVDAMEAKYACLSKLSCEDFENAIGCGAEEDAVFMLCQ